MKIKELQALAQKIQLEIKDREIPTYLKTFENLEKLLANFKKTKITKENKAMNRINVDCLTLLDLKKLEKNYSNRTISKKILESNSLVTKDGFILFKKLDQNQN